MSHSRDYQTWGERGGCGNSQICGQLGRNVMTWGHSTTGVWSGTSLVGLSRLTYRVCANRVQATSVRTELKCRTLSWFHKTGLGKWHVGLSDVSSWLNDFCWPLPVHHISKHVMLISLITEILTLINWLRWCLPGFYTLKLYFSQTY